MPDTDGIALIVTEGVAVIDGVIDATEGDGVTLSDELAVGEAVEVRDGIGVRVATAVDVDVAAGVNVAVGVVVEVEPGGDGSTLDSLGVAEGIDDGIGGQSQHILTLIAKLKVPSSRRHAMENGRDGNVVHGLGRPIMSPAI